MRKIGEQAAKEYQIEKALDNMELQGEAMNQLLEAAAKLGKDLSLGKKFDAVG